MTGLDEIMTIEIARRAAPTTRSTALTRDALSDMTPSFGVEGQVSRLRQATPGLEAWPSNGFELSGPAKTPSAYRTELARSAPASAYMARCALNARAASIPRTARLCQTQDDPEDQEGKVHILCRVDNDGHPSAAEAPARKCQEDTANDVP